MTFEELGDFGRYDLTAVELEWTVGLMLHIKNEPKPKDFYFCRNIVNSPYIQYYAHIFMISQGEIKNLLFHFHHVTINYLISTYTFYGIS